MNLCKLHWWINWIDVDCFDAEELVADASDGSCLRMGLGNTVPRCGGRRALGKQNCY